MLTPVILDHSESTALVIWQLVMMSCVHRHLFTHVQPVRVQDGASSSLYSTASLILLQEFGVLCVFL